MAKTGAKIGSADIASQLRREISAGKLRRNDRLPPERSLAERFGVARNTVREALGRLAAESFIEVRPGSGAYVTYESPARTPDAIAQANPLELIDARFALEPHICRLCVLHGRRADFEALEALCIHMENCVEDPVAFAEADTAFHQRLAQSTGNRLLVWIMGRINEVRGEDDWTLMRHLTLDAAMIRNYNAQHRAILDALRDRQPEQAAGCMKDHLETARLSLTRVAET
jgi:DNA-binding FadR family transcriptional regulator